MGQPNNPQGGNPKTVNRTLLIVFFIIGLLQIILLIVGFSFPFQIISIILNLIGLFYTVTQAAAPNFSNIGNMFRRLPRSVNIAIPIILCLLLLLSLAGNYLLVSHSAISFKPPTPTPTQHTSPTPTATPTHSPTPTSVVTPTPTVTVLVRTGTPFLVDPMNGPDTQDKWDVIDKPYASCGYRNGGYDIKVPANMVGGCATNAADTLLTNFDYEIDMTIVSGATNDTSPTRGAGLMFRYENQTGASNYGVSFQQDGSYYIFTYSNGVPGASLGVGNCLSFNQGPNQTNLIDIEAKGNTIMLFVNGVYVTAVMDGQFQSGYLGVQIGSGPTSSEVVFSNLKVWKL